MKFAKIIGTFFITVLFTLALCAISSSAKVYEAPKIPEGYEITVDGKIDPIWTLAEAQAIDQKDTTSFVDTDTTGTIKFLWDDNGYYVLVEIDRHGTPVAHPCTNETYAIQYSDDCVWFGAVNGGSEQGWTHAGLVEYEYTCMMAGDADGNFNLYGWFAAYGEDKAKYSLRLVDEDKFVVEMYIDWINPMNAYCYGAAGVGEGSVIMCDATVWLHNPDGSKSFMAWNMEKWDQMSSPHFGYLVLSGDEVDVSKLPKEDTPAETPENTADGTVTTPVERTVADINEDNTADNKSDSKTDKNIGKKENAPQTVDTASVIAIVGIVAFGSYIVTKKKHR